MLHIAFAKTKGNIEKKHISIQNTILYFANFRAWATVTEDNANWLELLNTSPLQGSN